LLSAAEAVKGIAATMLSSITAASKTEMVFFVNFFMYILLKRFIFQPSLLLYKIVPGKAIANSRKIIHHIHYKGFAHELPSQIFEKKVKFL